MTSRSIPAIDPGGVARTRGAEGVGIVVAVVGTGIDGKHPHFARYANLDLPPELRHCDVTLLRDREDRLSLVRPSAGALADEASIARLPPSDDELLSKEALIDRSGQTTHCAGIIAGHAEESDDKVVWHGFEPSMSGVAPRCKLLSLKAIDDEGTGNEYDVLRALDIVIGLNARAGKLAIQIVIVPLSITHDVANYACGRTPVCQAIDRLIDSGVVVIVPSGNAGYFRVATPEKKVRELANLMTISDPGNAERAITVGATHRFRTQEYGASYFSGRGPTLDGRTKPDLLAPGEGIQSAVPAGDEPQSRRTKVKGRSGKKRSATYESKDGTTMAAAHVAGAVAVLLSARPELIGHPELVKELLLSTATDLGRSPYSQGRGLVNLSRALGDERRTEPPPASPPQAQALPDAARVPAQAGPETPGILPAPGKKSGKRFAVAFSFPGEHRDFVKRVVFALRETLNRSDIFYDRYYESELSRPDLDLYLLEIYGKQSELVVVFLSADYEKKQWCGGLEWRAIRELIKTREGYAVMPVRFDETAIPGLLSVDGYVSAERRDPEQIAELILERLQANRSRGVR